MVATGKAQFGVDFQDYLAPAYLSDLPVTAVAALIQHNTSGIISLKEKGMTSPKDLEGRTYATWDLPVEQATMKNVVESDGGDWSKVNLASVTVTDVISLTDQYRRGLDLLCLGWHRHPGQGAGYQLLLF